MSSSAKPVTFKVLEQIEGVFSFFPSVSHQQWSLNLWTLRFHFALLQPINSALFQSNKFIQISKPPSLSTLNISKIHFLCFLCSLTVVDKIMATWRSMLTKVCFLQVFLFFFFWIIELDFNYIIKIVISDFRIVLFNFGVMFLIVVVMFLTCFRIVSRVNMRGFKVFLGVDKV